MAAAVALALGSFLCISATVPKPASAQASIAPHTFISELSCDVTGQVTAGFDVPGAPETRARLAELGVSGVPDAVWIDLSLFDNGFAPGTFLNAGPVLVQQEGRRFNWFGLRTQTPHYYRLNAHVGDRWVELGNGRFDTPDCHLMDAMYCNRDTGNVIARFSTGPAGILEHAAPLADWVDLSLFDNGYAPGTFLNAGPFPPAERTVFEWNGLLSNRRHFYRLNTLYASAWAGQVWYEQVAYSIMTLDCRALPSVSPGSI